MDKINEILSKIDRTQIIIFVVIVIIVELIWAYQTTGFFKSGTPVKIQTTISKMITSNDLVLSAPKNIVKVGEIIPVSVNISSDKKTDGVDLVIKYDPNLLTVVEQSDQTPLKAGSIYSDYLVNKLDKENGTVMVSAVNSSSGGVVPNGSLGTILFKPKAVGTAKIILDFTKGSTTDSNITETQTSKDILDNVTNLEFNITP